MTIKFERFTSHRTKVSYYRIFEDENGKRDYHLVIRDYEFETLFKNMAKQLGYAVSKSITYEYNTQQDEAIKKLEEKIEQLDNVIEMNEHNCLYHIHPQLGKGLEKLEDKLDKLEDKVIEPAYPLYLRKDDFDMIRLDLQNQIDGLGRKKISHVEHYENIKTLQERLDKLEQDIVSNRDD